jgi:flavodoxin
MKTALLYGSTHGRTLKVVEAALKSLVIEPEIFNAKYRPEPEKLADCDLFLFFCPTYGDEELQEDMEDFICRFSLDLSGKYFVICELGNYYGYDDYTFGALAILRRCLLDLRGREFCSHLSLDAMPRVNWGQLDRWVAHVNRSLSGLPEGKTVRLTEDTAESGVHPNHSLRVGGSITTLK